MEIESRELRMKKTVCVLFLGLCLLIALRSSANQSTSPVGKHFERVVVVVFENTNLSRALKLPFFSELAKQGTLFTNFRAATHPSQGNYIAMTSGSMNGVRGNARKNLDVPHIADLLEGKGLTWKVYVGDYPGNCFTGMSHKRYARRHNPFISYISIQKNPKRCDRIVNSKEFLEDAERGLLPNYSFYIPNLNDDGHDTGAAFADRWYKKKIQDFLADTKLMTGTLLITTFDENGGKSGNLVYTSFNGPMVNANLILSKALNFYSLLNLFEDNWSLGSLGKQDETATPIPDEVWKNVLPQP